MNEILDSLISTHGDKYLICDCDHPLITHGNLEDEAKLYNLTNAQVDQIVAGFHSLTDKYINPQTLINTLSGGQKVILSVLLALASKAQHILFYDLVRSLDEERKALVLNLIESAKPAKTFLIIDELQ